MPTRALSLGIDIGGTKTHALLLEGDTTLAQAVLPSTPGEAAVVATALEAAMACLTSAGATLSELSTAGVGIPGQVDPRSGRVRTAVNLGISNLALGERLGDELGLAVSVENDVKAAALGARALVGGDDLTYLNIGTGIAAATIAGGSLVRGVGNAAGEIGHIPVDRGGELCECGQRGCLETLAGGGRVSERLRAAGLDLQTLFSSAEAGVRAARAEARQIVAGISAAVLVIVLAHGSQRVVLNGGVLHHCPGLFEATLTELTALAAGSAFIASLDLPGRLVLLGADYPSAAIGAAIIGRQGTMVGV